MTRYSLGNVSATLTEVLSFVCSSGHRQPQIQKTPTNPLFRGKNVQQSAYSYTFLRPSFESGILKFGESEGGVRSGPGGAVTQTSQVDVKMAVKN